MMNNYSPNMLKTFEECPRKFFLKYVQNVTIPQRSAFFDKGKKIHALASYYLNGFDVSKMEQALNADEKLAWESLKLNKYFNLHPVNTEYNLSCKIDKYWIGGRLDALVSEGENYFILDYKTGKIPANAEQDFQTITYLLCADKLLKRKLGKGGYKSLKFAYLGLKENTEKEIILTEELKNNYEEKIISTCEKINFAIKTNVFAKNPNCELICEYKKICME